MNVRTRRADKLFLSFNDNKKDVQRPYDHFAGGLAPRSLPCVRKQAILLLSYSEHILTFLSCQVNALLISYHVTVIQAVSFHLF